MSAYEDADGVDGPFNRTMNKATREDRVRRYHVVAVNERTGARTRMTRSREPVTHAEGCTMLRKISRYKGRRVQLQEVPAPVRA